MNQLYKFFLDETERIFNEKKSACDNRISKARKGYPIHSDILRELNARESDLEGQLYEKSIDRFFREMEKDYNLDSQLTQEVAFLNCCLKFNINNDKSAISLLAEYQANGKVKTYCYDLMNVLKKNLNSESNQHIDVSRVKTNNQYPIWQKKNHTEFMQLLEALILLDRIQPRPGQSKRELFIEIANFFGIQLSKNAESNLGKGRKTKLMPMLFNDLYKMWKGRYSNLERK
jgi:hypothetical protein